MPTDGIGHESMGSKASDRLKVEMKHVAGISFRMHHEFTDGNCSSTTFGTKFIETLRAGAWTAVSCNVCCTHRCREDTVTEGHPTQLDGACEMGVFVLVHKRL